MPGERVSADVAEHRSGPSRGRVASWLTAAALGLLTVAIVRFVWGDWNPVPQFHDEAAHALQADIYASGRWSAPSPPEPAFFEQTHVLLEPVLAAKYLPGHSLVLAPGALVGRVGWIPFLLSGVTGALIFLLAARVTTPAVGLLTWAVWVFSLDNLHWRVSYFSELTTSALLLVAWWLLLQWKERPKGAWLALLAVTVGWGAITRPWTMLALAVPIGWVVLRRVWKLRAWGQLAAAMAIGAATLLLVPVWSQATLGSLSPTPHELYTERYIPWDRMGFGLDDHTPMRPESAEVAAISREFVQLHREHTVARLPRIFAERARHLVHIGPQPYRGYPDATSPEKILLLVLGAVGLLAGWRRALFPVASACALILAYLVYAHPPHWTLYYLEIFPVGAFLVALGVWQVARWLNRVDAGLSFRRFGLVFVIVLVGLLLPPWLDRVVRQRTFEALVRADLARFEQCLTVIEPPAGVFVRYAADHDPHRSYVRNVPDLAAAPYVTALDRGAENARLVQALPGRPWYLLDEATWTVAPWDGLGGPGGPVQCAEP